MLRQKDFYKEVVGEGEWGDWHPEDSDFWLVCDGWQRFLRDCWPAVQKWASRQGWKPVMTWAEWMEHLHPFLADWLDGAARKAAYGVAPAEENDLANLLKFLRFWGEIKPQVISACLGWRCPVQLLQLGADSVLRVRVSELSSASAKLLYIPRGKEQLVTEEVSFFSTGPGGKLEVWWRTKEKYYLGERDNYYSFYLRPPAERELPRLRFIEKDGTFVGVPENILKIAGGLPPALEKK